jgi:hypothetical protein
MANTIGVMCYFYPCSWCHEKFAFGLHGRILLQWRHHSQRSQLREGLLRALWPSDSGSEAGLVSFLPSLYFSYTKQVSDLIIGGLYGRKQEQRARQRALDLLAQLAEDSAVTFTRYRAGTIRASTTSSGRVPQAYQHKSKFFHGSKMIAK